MISICRDFTAPLAAGKYGVEGAKTVIRTRHLSPNSYRAASNQCDHLLGVRKCSPMVLLDFFPATAD